MRPCFQPPCVRSIVWPDVLGARCDRLCLRRDYGVEPSAHLRAPLCECVRIQRMATLGLDRRGLHTKCSVLSFPIFCCRLRSRSSGGARPGGRLRGEAEGSGGDEERQFGIIPLCFVAEGLGRGHEAGTSISLLGIWHGDGCINNLNLVAQC